MSDDSDLREIVIEQYMDEETSHLSETNMRDFRRNITIAFFHYDFSEKIQRVSIKICESLEKSTYGKIFWEINGYDPSVENEHDLDIPIFGSIKEFIPGKWFKTSLNQKRNEENNERDSDRQETIIQTANDEKIFKLVFKSKSEIKRRLNLRRVIDFCIFFLSVISLLKLHLEVNNIKEWFPEIFYEILTGFIEYMLGLLIFGISVYSIIWIIHLFLVNKKPLYLIKSCPECHQIVHKIKVYSPSSGKYEEKYAHWSHLILTPFAKWKHPRDKCSHLLLSKKEVEERWIFSKVSLIWDKFSLKRED